MTAQNKGSIAGNPLIAIGIIDTSQDSIIVYNNTYIYIYLLVFLYAAMPSIARQNKTPIETLFRKHGGLLRTKEALASGISPRTLYQLEADGTIEKLSRGLYHLSSLPPLGSPDIITVTKRIHPGVICLISALQFHGLGTQVPHEVYVAVPRGTEPPRIDYPPIRCFWFSEESYGYGIEEQKVDGAVIRIYSEEKTIADCFKYRNKLGLDVAMEALKSYLSKKRSSPDKVLKAASACRMEKVIRPYLEALI